MNLSNLSVHSLLGRLLRAPLKLLPRGMQIQVLSGRLRGKKWIIGSSITSCWLGIYEYDKQKLFSRSITPGSVIFDIGANVGFYTLLASELTGRQGKVFAFEPLPRNLGLLRTHLQINRVANVTIVEAAVSDTNGLVRFDEGPRGEMAHLTETGGVEVRSVSLDVLFECGKIPPPHFIKMDIEGAELGALLGMQMLLRQSHPAIFLATHGPAIHEKCCHFLENLGYELTPIGALDLQTTREILAAPAQDRS